MAETPADAAATAADASSNTDSSPDASADALTPEQQAAVDAADKPDVVQALITSQARELRQAQGQLRTAQRALQELEDAGKSELERASTRAERAEQRVAELERNQLVSAVAARHSLPPELAERLRGETEQELEADAKALAKLMPGETPDPGALGAGARSAAATGGSRGFSEQIRQRARR